MLQLYLYVFIVMPPRASCSQRHSIIVQQLYGLSLPIWKCTLRLHHHFKTIPKTVTAQPVPDLVWNGPSIICEFIKVGNE